MLKDNTVVATAPVKDLETARRFYSDTLKLEAEPGNEESAVMYRAGNSKLLVYESELAGTNKATAVTWTVDDVEGAVQELKSRGVSFEHYDDMGGTRKGDVHIMGDMKAAWFKDPDGNIHALVSG
jgi:catechol 2,3-dioxygenase-like lactoylglutathione lyase family enzyme